MMMMMMMIIIIITTTTITYHISTTKLLMSVLFPPIPLPLTGPARLPRLGSPLRSHSSLPKGLEELQPHMASC